MYGGERIDPFAVTIKVDYEQFTNANTKYMK